MNIGAITTTATSAAPASNLGLQDFMKILLTQLTYQDPLKPMDNQEFIAQVAQFTSLEQMQQVNSKVEQLVANQAALQSIGLVGRTVDVTINGAVTTGTVSALSLTGDSPTLTITSGGATLPGISLSQIAAIR
jgi:flagellar basal-body rod modification protein FlgD